ncbi:hypothetical protein H4R18_000631 [Coemansia javaensis]|uniref:HMG box domain-containing protein n=1 Tax=Coemansia javaensis TaxID=2761396 RepID=A0A9W8LLG5_9FUNG|nr:hypothetical protein H4R18_000631 [Coemansia javaensis]
MANETALTSVRQFRGEDGSSYIEHVPGHCLVFIPNTANVSSLLSEMRKERKPRTRAKPKAKSSKPTNAFIKYRNHKIEELKGQFPDISQTEISRMAAECWRAESEEHKQRFRDMYKEEKELYDLNKNKRLRMGDSVASEGEYLAGAADVLSQYSLQSASPMVAPLPDPPADCGLGLGLGLGLGVPTGFNTGRRRSHTMPQSGFHPPGMKRRISDELRKHLASKCTSAYLAASVAGPLGAYPSAAPGDLAPFSQHMPFDFAFAPQQAGASGTSTVSTYATPSYDAPPLALPINPNFPLSEFATPGPAPAPVPAPASTVAPPHSDVLASMATPLSIDNAAYAAADDCLSTVVPAHTVDPGLPSLLDTAGLGALAGEGVHLGSGYLATGAPSAISSAAPWAFQHAYTPLQVAAGYAQGQPQPQPQPQQ